MPSWMRAEAIRSPHRLGDVRRSPEPTRSERTRTALRDAALARFVRDGFDATSVADIAADAGVSERTYYRYFADKYEVLLIDYEARLDWFRRALSVRPRDEDLIESVRVAIASFPDDPAVVEEIARLRSGMATFDRIEPHVRRVEIELAREIEGHLLDRQAGEVDPDLRVRLAVVGRTVAAALFSAMDQWMAGPADDLDELSRLTDLALEVVQPVAD
jgi:AcrR family transcriptional regulator